MLRRSVALIVCSSLTGLAGCPSTRSEVVPDPVVEGPPRGERLATMVIGVWGGVAEDGTDTKEDVDLTLGADRSYSLSAGMVEMNRTWRVDGDLVILEPDPEDLTSEGGICFRAERVTERRIEGRWAYSDLSGRCNDRWYPVQLDRVE